jgi:hypothetical protein
MPLGLPVALAMLSVRVLRLRAIDMAYVPRLTRQDRAAAAGT